MNKEFVKIKAEYMNDASCYIKLSTITDLRHYEYTNSDGSKKMLQTEIVRDNTQYPVSLNEYLEIAYNLLDNKDFIKLKLDLIDKGYCKEEITPDDL